MATEKLETAVRREQIARAGLATVMAGGVRGLNMAVVAHRVGIAPSAIYRHFRNKDELVDAILDHLRGRMIGNLDAAMAEADEPLEIIRGALMRQIELIRENQAIPRLLFSEELYARQPERKTRIYKMLTEYAHRLEELVRAGQKRGSIRKDIDPAVVSIMFFGVFQPVGVLWFLSDGRFDATRQARVAWEILRGAIAMPVTPAKPATPTTSGAPATSAVPANPAARPRRHAAGSRRPRAEKEGS
jgi:TetR/AcrR family transcriptional regulator, fatty acid metabolism regulator protein